MKDSEALEDGEILDTSRLSSLVKQPTNLQCFQEVISEKRIIYHLEAERSKACEDSIFTTAKDQFYSSSEGKMGDRGSRIEERDEMNNT